MTRAERHIMRQTPHAGCLTPRELEIAKLEAGGRHNDEIARLLGISRETCKTHRSRIYHKLGIPGVGASRELRIRGREFGL